MTRVCLVSASGQNVFFAEILEAFGAALRQQGVTVEESVDCFPPPEDDLVYLYVPHEYHPLVHELAHPTPAQLRRTVALSTEQPGTSWFDVASELAARAGGAVDINALGARELGRRGIAAEHAPIGYVPAWDLWQGGEAERSVDLAFMGGHTERRAKAIARCAPALRDRRCAIHLVEVRPHVAGSSYFLSHDRKWRLLADTKVMLNVHRSELAYMEWHRVVGAVLNGCVVLSEHSLGTEPFVAGEHFVSASHDALPGVLEGLIDDPDRLEKIRRAAYELVKDEMPMERAAEALLRAVERAAHGPVGPGAGGGVPMPRPLPAPAPDWEAYPASAGDLLPLRMALKHLVVHTHRLERRIDSLVEGPSPEPGDVVEQLGPERDDPRVSVLLTVHNYADYVGDALRSVALSDLRDVEVIAVDDASTDESVDAIRAACADLQWLSVRLVRRGRNGGLPAARNLALEHARGDLLFVLDADNMVLPQGLRRLADALDGHPEAAFAYGIIEAVGVNGPVGLMNWLDWDPQRLRQGNYIDAMSMIRRSALDGIGGYPTDSALHGWEDFAVWVAFADAGLAGHRVPDFVARYRANPHSMIALTNTDSMAAWATLLRRYPSLAVGGGERLTA
jgi:hypothetical protein